jgi:hypothetical protein
MGSLGLTCDQVKINFPVGEETTRRHVVPIAGARLRSNSSKVTKEKIWARPWDVAF